MDRDLLRFLTAGSVDDGKSTLIGRLLHDSNGVYEDQLQAVERDSLKWGHAGGAVDLSLLTDGLKAEREQGITIDVAYRYFGTARRKFIIADTPGHVQYTRNMATGASNCDLAVILIDARAGVVQQSRRHSYLVALLGIKHLVVAINKMDLVGWRPDVFEDIRTEYLRFAASLGVSDLHFIPMSALLGDNVVQNSTHMPWYEGPPLLRYLEGVPIAGDRNQTDFRFPVQLVIRPDGSFRGLAGTIASGVVRRGDEVLLLPSGRTSRVSRLVTYDGDLEQAPAAAAVTVVLQDDLDVSRGDMLVHPHHQPLSQRDLEAEVVWLDERPLEVGAAYWLKHTTNLVPATVTEILYGVDVNTLESHPTARLGLNDVGGVRLTVSRTLHYDPYRINRATGAFILIDRLTNGTVGAGMIRSSGARSPVDRSMLHHKEGEVTAAMRIARLTWRPAVIWLTGLPRSGKAPLAYRLERRLFELGVGVYAMEASAVRTGLNADLTFASEDRTENMRRLAEVAKILMEAGLVAICAAVSPYRNDRENVRQLVGLEHFVEVYCNAPAAVCERRDPDGLYARARRGDIKSFTGVSAPYEPPEHPDLTLHIEEASLDDLVTRLLEVLRRRHILGAP